MKKILILLIISHLALFALGENINFKNTAAERKFNGNIPENLMHDYFKKSGWIQLKGEVGNNGIDGLYIKKKDGVISEVLFSESKYNTSQLVRTKDGSRQMSKQWLLNKLNNDLIKDAQKKGDIKALKEYQQILKHVQHDN